MVHAGPAAGAVEVGRLGTRLHRRGQRAFLEVDVVEGGDPVEQAQAELGQQDVEGARDAAQLHRDPVPAAPLVVEGPPQHCVVVRARHAQVHVHRAHRDT